MREKLHFFPLPPFIADYYLLSGVISPSDDAPYLYFVTNVGLMSYGVDLPYLWQSTGWVC
jgi:hypothetical protein